MVEYEKLNLNFSEITKEILADHGGDSLILPKLPDELVIVGLMGKMRSGKDTIANWAVRQHNFQRFAFADKLKHLAHKYTQTPKTKEKPRELYQWFGTECVKVDPFVWVKVLNHELTRYIKWKRPKNIIITDFRQPHESLWAHQNGIPVILVDAKEKVRKERAEKEGGTWGHDQANHITEQWADILYCDYLIDNNKEPESAFLEFDKDLTDIRKNRFDRKCVERRIDEMVDKWGSN